jgi:hypothetical protein
MDYTLHGAQTKLLREASLRAHVSFVYTWQEPQVTFMQTDLKRKTAKNLQNVDWFIQQIDQLSLYAPF